MAEPTNPNFNPQVVNQELQNINNYLESNMPSILEGMTEAQIANERYLELNRNRIAQSFPTQPNVDNLINGNTFTGPNPGLKDGTPGGAVDYARALFDKQALDIASLRDPLKKARLTSFDASRHGYNFERYYEHPKFKEFGFSLYRDNESIYTNNSSFMDDFRRMGPQWLKLAGLGASGLFRNWGKWGTAGEIEDAARMEHMMGVAQSNREGVGAWTTNFLSNSAYTVGILGEIALEELALVAGTALTGGGMAPYAGVRTAANIGRVGKSFKLLIETMKGLDKAKSFWTSAKGAAQFINPLQRTTEFARKAMTTGTAANRLSDMAKFSKTASNFYFDMREINAVLGESKLEGGFTSNKVSTELFNEFYEKNNRQPNEKEAKQIYERAYEAGVTATMLNIPAIYLSNKIVIGTALRGIRPMAHAMANANMKNALYKVVREATDSGKPLYKAVPKSMSLPKNMFSKDGFKKFRTGFIKDMKTRPGRTLGSGLAYFNANFAEGLQEFYQEGVSEGVSDYYIKDYYEKVYGDPMLAGKNSVWAAFKHGLGSQLSGQGLDVFLSGFLMGGAIQGPMQYVYNKGTLANLKIQDFRNKTDRYQKYVERQQQSMETLAKALNDVSENSTEYAKWLDFNLRNQIDLADQYDLAEATGDENLMQRTKDESLFSHVFTLLKGGRGDIFIDQLEGLNQLSDQELAEVFPDSEALSTTPRERLNKAIEKAKTIEKVYKRVNEDIENPFDPDMINKKKDQEAYQNEVHLHEAFEQAKMHAVFSEYSALRAAELAEEFSSRFIENAPFKGLESFYFTAIYRPFVYGQGKEEDEFVEMLQSEITVLRNGDAKKQKEADKKQGILDKYRDLQSAMRYYALVNNTIKSAPMSAQAYARFKEFGATLLTPEELERTSEQLNRFSENITMEQLLQEKINEELQKSYEQYIRELGSLTEEDVLPNKVQGSFNDLVNFINASKDARGYMRTVNYLADPVAFVYMAEKIANSAKEVHARRAELHRQALEAFRSENLRNTLIQQLADMFIYFSPEDVEAFVNENKFPSKLIDANTGEEINLETDPRRTVIMNLFEAYEVEQGFELQNKPTFTEPEVASAASAAPVASQPVATPAATVATLINPKNITSTTPFAEMPPDLQRSLQDAFNAANMTGDITDWIAESPDAIIIIKDYVTSIETPISTEPLESQPIDAEDFPPTIKEIQRFRNGRGKEEIIGAQIVTEENRQDVIFFSKIEDTEKLQSNTGYVYSENSGNSVSQFLIDYELDPDNVFVGFDPKNYSSLRVIKEVISSGEMGQPVIRIIIKLKGKSGISDVESMEVRVGTPFLYNKVQRPDIESQDSPVMFLQPVQLSLFPGLYTKTLELTPDQSGYVNKDDPEDTYDRATSFKPNPYEGSTENAYSAQRGTLIDGVIRFAAMPNGRTGKSLFDQIAAYESPLGDSQIEPAFRTLVYNAVSEYLRYVKENSTTIEIEYTSDFIASLANDLISLGKYFAKEKMEVFSTVPTLWGTINGNKIAGTVDLIIRKDNKYYIIDLKTAERSRRVDYNSEDSIYKENDSAQLSIYAELWEQRTGNRIAGRYILPMITTSKQVGKQLTSTRLELTNDDRKTPFIPVTPTDLNQLIKPVAKAEAPVSNLGFENLGNIGNQGFAIMEAEINKTGRSIISNISRATLEQRQKIDSDIEELKKKYPEKNITSRIENNNLIIEDGVKAPVSDKKPVPQYPILDKYKGKIIYGTAMTGKSAASKHNKDIVDADEIILEEMTRQIPGFKLLPGEEFRDAAYRFSTLPGADRDAVNNKVLARIMKLKEEGKTILTGTTAFIPHADFVFTIPYDNINKKLGLQDPVQISKLRGREKTQLESSGKTAIPLTEFFVDILFRKDSSQILNAIKKSDLQKLITNIRSIFAQSPEKIAEFYEVSDGQDITLTHEKLYAATMLRLQDLLKEQSISSEQYTEAKNEINEIAGMTPKPESPIAPEEVKASEEVIKEGKDTSDIDYRKIAEDVENKSSEELDKDFLDDIKKDCE